MLRELLDDYEKLQNLAGAFHQSRRTASPSYGCVAALDGIAIEAAKFPDENMPRTFFLGKECTPIPFRHV